MNTENVESKHHWRAEAETVSFDLTSDGTTGDMWIARLHALGFQGGKHSNHVLRSSDFKLTRGVTTRIVVLKGLLVTEGKLTEASVRREAARRGLATPNAEIACLIRVAFSDEDIERMGLETIVAMHQPIRDADGHPSLLAAGRGSGGCWFGVQSVWPTVATHYELDRDSGFAFVDATHKP